LKVIERNENYVFPTVAIKRRIVCPTCKSLLEITEKDIWNSSSALKLGFLKKCKVCFGELDDLEITKEEANALQQKENKKHHYEKLAFTTMIVVAVLICIVGLVMNILT